MAGSEAKVSHVYLLHFGKPLCHAQHYCGWTLNGIEQRLAVHLSGHGAKLVKAVVANGSAVVVARSWECGGWREARQQERRMKNTHNLPSYCPVCRELKNNNKERR